MKVFITKYALTQGIFEVDAEISDNCPTMVVETASGYRNCYHGEGNEWHRTMESADAKANKMRLAKINSLKKQIQRLNELDFG